MEAICCHCLIYSIILEGVQIDFNFFRMVGEKSTAQVARSDDWEGIDTKRHQKERHPVCTRYILNGGPPIGGDEVGKLYF